jgi:hypothetical protein
MNRRERFVSLNDMRKILNFATLATFLLKVCLCDLLCNFYPFAALREILFDGRPGALHTKRPAFSNAANNA